VTSSVEGPGLPFVVSCRGGGIPILFEETLFGDFRKEGPLGRSWLGVY